MSQHETDEDAPVRPSLQVLIDLEFMRPLLREVAREVIEQLEAGSSRAGDRLAFTEAEAAGMLDLKAHVLRDERLRCRIACSQIVGSRIRYLRSDLLEYLAGRRIEPPRPGAALP